MLHMSVLVEEIVNIRILTEGKNINKPRNKVNLQNLLHFIPQMV